MKSKIAIAFEKCKKEKRPALLTYTVAGDNTKKNSLKIAHKYFDYEVYGELKNSDLLHDQGFFIGNHHYPIKNELELVKEILTDEIC